MTAPRVERRLTAVLVADIVGYSRLMQRDEDRTHERLQVHRKELVEPLITEYRGRIVKLTGDGALCEFQSVVDAVACAMQIQQGMSERERELPEEERIRFRIAVNIGDDHPSISDMILRSRETNKAGPSAVTNGISRRILNKASRIDRFGHFAGLTASVQMKQSI